MTSRSLGHRAPLLWLLLPYMAGLAIGKAGDFLPVSWLLALALVAVLIAGAALIMGGRRAALWGPALISAMVVAGAASYALHRLRLATWETLPPREASLGLQVDRVFVPADPKRASGLATIVRAAPHLRELIGQPIYFSLNLRAGEAPPIRSALVTATGILVTLPRNPPAETFDGYLAGAGINFRFTRGRLTAEDRPAHPYYRFCAELGKRCHELLGLGIETKRPALAGLLRAMMLGTTHDLSTEQHTLFMQSGTMHLFAISGLNIGVIAGVLQAGLLLLRFPGWARFVVGAGLLWVFVDVTGAAPSAIRAFAMAVFIQAAFVFRRPANMLAALVASALVVLLVAPLQLFSASFLMSYAIVAALLVLGLPLGVGLVGDGVLLVLELLLEGLEALLPGGAGGGRLRVGLPGTFDSLNPFNVKSGTAAQGLVGVGLQLQAAALQSGVNAPHGIGRDVANVVVAIQVGSHQPTSC